MIRSIIKQILPDIQALNFADLVAGVVTQATQNIMDKGNAVAKKIFPIYENSPTACQNGDYSILTPDEKYKSIIYFEEINSSVVAQTNYEIKMSTDVRLVAWFNLKKINNTVNSDTLLRLIMQAIPEQVAGFNEIENIKIKFNGIENKTPTVFSNYTYDEAETQYLLFPYDYGSLLYTVTYSLNKCLDDININPNCGNRV